MFISKDGISTHIPLSTAYDSTTNFLPLGSTVLVCISKEGRCKEDRCGNGNFEFDPVTTFLRVN